MKKVLFVSFAAMAMAVAAGNAAAYEVYGSVGSEGLGVGGTLPIGSMANVRMEYDGLKFSKGVNAGDLHYDGKLTLSHAGLYADFFPAPQFISFRVTGGLLIGNDNLDGTASALSSDYSYHGVVIPADAYKIHARATMPHVRPYLGIGFGHSPIGGKGLSTFCDLGVAFGKPHVDYEVPADVVQLVGQETVDKEAADFRSKADKVKFYPVLKVGLAWRW